MRQKTKQKIITAVWAMAGSFAAARASAQFVSPSDIVIEQLNGDGGGPLNTDSVSLLEYNPSNIAAGPDYTLNLPTNSYSWDGNSVGLVMPDTQASGNDGQLTLSEDGHSMVLATYLASVGYPINAGEIDVDGQEENPDSPSLSPRDITVIDSEGDINGSTQLSGVDDYNGLAIRQVASLNGTQFWLTGNNAKPYGPGQADFGGLRYATLGATQSTSLNQNGGIDVRTNTIFQGQLYAGSGSDNSPAGEHTIYQIGAGIPNSGAQYFAPLPAAGIGVHSPILNPAPGYNTVNYVSTLGNQSSTFVTLANGTMLMYNSDSTGNTFDKYIYSNGVWDLQGRLSFPDGPQDLVASVSGNTVTLFLTSFTSVYEVTDNGSTPFNSLPLGSPVLTPQGNAEFRGISFAPSSSGAVGNEIWGSTVGASWASTSSWANGIPNAAGATATFGPESPGLAANGVVTLDGSETVGHIVFNNSTASYTLAPGNGGSLTINNSGVGATGVPDIYVTIGNHAISAPVNLVAGVSVDFQNNATLLMSGPITGMGDFTVNGEGTLIMDAAATFSGTTNISGTAALQVGNGDANGSLPGAIVDNGLLTFDRIDSSIAANSISGTGALMQIGSGTVTLSGINSYSGPTMINAGTLVIGASGALSPNSPVTIGNSATGSTMRFATGIRTATLSSLTINTGSKLDITNNTLSIQYGANGDPTTSIVASLDSGFAGGAWTGTGIISSVAAANHSSNSVGYASSAKDGADSAPVFGLGNASANNVIVKYVQAGDANLDGKVNFTDFSILIANYGLTGTDWAHGNFAYGPGTNFTDFSKVIANYGLTLSPAGSSAVTDGGSGTVSLAGDARVLPAIGQLPEPGSITLIAAGAAGLLARHRRRSNGARQRRI